MGGALHLLGGGNLNGRPLAARQASRQVGARVVFMSAALDNDWFLPGRHFGQAIGQMQHLTLLTNGCDRVLKRYPRLYGSSCGPQALGYTGMAAPQLLGDQQSKLEQYDVCCIVGPKHDWRNYLFSGSTARLLALGLIGPAPAAPAPTAAIGEGPPEVAAVSANSEPANSEPESSERVVAD